MDKSKIGSSAVGDKSRDRALSSPGAIESVLLENIYCSAIYTVSNKCLGRFYDASSCATTNKFACWHCRMINVIGLGYVKHCSHLSSRVRPTICSKRDRDTW